MRLLHVDGDEESLLAALLFEAAGVPEEDARIRIAALSTEQRAELLGDMVGERDNRRHRPGRGFEALRYRFEVVADYGAFRDLQRHRMLTVQWQRLTPDLGAGVPEELEAAGVADLYREGLERSRGEYARLVDAGFEREAVYALCLGYRIRFVLDLNAREAMHLIELRSGREGHPGLPRGRARDAPADRVGPPRGRRGDVARRHRRRAAPRAHPLRDAHRRRSSTRWPRPDVSGEASCGSVGSCGTRRLSPRTLAMVRARSMKLCSASFASTFVLDERVTLELALERRRLQLAAAERRTGLR